MVDPLYLIWLERFEQADLSVCRLCKVASEELHDGEGDDPDGDEDGEEDPVELVEEAQVGSSLSNKAPLSEADEENSVKDQIRRCYWVCSADSAQQKL